MGDHVRILDKAEVKNAKYCEKLLREAGIQPDTTEVLLSRKGLVENCSMKRFHCLEALWLNHNFLTKIAGLDTNVQIKALYLHNNKISTLQGSLKFLRHIRTLSLYNNRLQDLEATLPLLEHLTHLEELDLSGNPLANEVNYRLHVIATFPTLKVMDKHEVTAEERLEARRIFEGIKASNVCFGKTKPSWTNPPKQAIASLSVTTKDMYKEIKQHKKQLEDEKAAKELAATSALNHTQSTGGGVPLATAVETVTMNSKRLKDLLDDVDMPQQKKDEMKRNKHGDFFAMKLFVTPQSVIVSASRVFGAAHFADRTTHKFSRVSHGKLCCFINGRLDPWNGHNFGSGCTERERPSNERYAKYEALKSLTQTSSELHDWLEWI